ncbi:transketolase [bacterium]|nr:transketolase [bacterium]
MLAKHLDKKIHEDQVELAHTRDGYGQGLLEAGRDDSRIVALCADLTESTRTHYFAEEFPNRFFEIGIAEQNMASVASGLAAMGKVPFIASYAMFSPGRNWEQIRTTIAYNESNVKIVGAHAGVSVGPDGATHQAIEDIALMRVIPGMTVMAPADIHEAQKMVRWAAEYIGPVYIRIGREKTPVVTSEESPFVPGKALEIYSPDDAKVALLSTGTLLHNAIMAGKELTEAGISTAVYHFGTIKPLDTETLADIVTRFDQLVTIEEHQVAGGFGSAVCEYVCEHAPTKVTRMGVQDMFGQSGSQEDLLQHYDMDVASIIELVTQSYEI